MSPITPADAIEAIWDAVQSAADGYHNTQQWCEEGHFAPDVSYWKQIRAAVDLAKSLAPTPAAPEPPVPVDLEAIEADGPWNHLDDETIGDMAESVRLWSEFKRRDGVKPGSSYALEALEMAEALMRAVVARKRPHPQPGGDKPSLTDAGGLG